MLEKIYELPIVYVFKSKNLSTHRVKKNKNNELFKVDDEFIKETVIYCNKSSTKIKENKNYINHQLPTIGWL